MDYRIKVDEGTYRMLRMEAARRLITVPGLVRGLVSGLADGVLGIADRADVANGSPGAVTPEVPGSVEGAFVANPVGLSTHDVTGSGAHQGAAPAAGDVVTNVVGVEEAVAALGTPADTVHPGSDEAVLQVHEVPFPIRKVGKPSFQEVEPPIDEPEGLVEAAAPEEPAQEGEGDSDGGQQPLAQDQHGRTLEERNRVAAAVLAQFKEGHRVRPKNLVSPPRTEEVERSCLACASTLEEAVNPRTGEITMVCPFCA